MHDDGTGHQKIRRAFRLGVRRAASAEVDDEVAFHLEMRVQALMARGLTPDAARHEAMRQFGDVASVRAACVTYDKERDRAMQRTDLLNELGQSLTFALRLLRRNAGVTAVIVLSLAIGVGANTAIFTLVDAVLLRQLPVKDAGRLVGIGDPARIGGRSSGNQRTDLLSYPLYQDLRDRGARFVAGLAATGRAEGLAVRTTGSGAQVERPSARFVSANYFTVLGLAPQKGRNFDPADERAGSGAEVVISDAYWTRRFSRAENVVGRDITINEVKFTIVGVAPAGFTGEIVGRTYDFWLPISMQDILRPAEPALARRDVSWLLLIGRLAPGVTLPQARTGFSAAIREIEAAHAGSPDEAKQLATAPVQVESAARGFSAVRKVYETPLFTLMIGVALLMVIICANVANLLLARAMARGREMAVRMAIGAGRARLVRQLLTESMVLGLMSALAGLALAWFGSRLLLTLVADGGALIPIETRMDMPVLAFTMVITFAAVALFGLAPALRGSRVDLATATRAGSRASSGNVGARGQRAPLGKLLVAGQVGLSLVLLAGSALLVRNLQALQNSDTGLDRDHLLVVDVDALARGYRAERFQALVHGLVGAMGRIPGVEAVSFSENGIFSGSESNTGISVPAFTVRTARDSTTFYDQVGPGYVRAIGGRMIAGRDLESRDEGNVPLVAVVNESFARFFFAGGDAVGKRFSLDKAEVTIVGVVADTKDHTLEVAPERRAYFPYLQGPPGDASRLRLEVRTTGDPAQAAHAVRDVITRIDPTLPIASLAPLSVTMRQSVRQERLLTRVATGFGVLALLLAAVGLYGVMTYAVTRRTAEIGLRVALGAQHGDVIGMVLGDALRLVALGIVVGVPLALASTRLLKSQLQAVTPTDPGALLVALGVLILSATVAALLPALRAARIAPLVALRED